MVTSFTYDLMTSPRLHMLMWCQTDLLCSACAQNFVGLSWAARRLLVESEYLITSSGSFVGVGFAVVRELPPNVPKKLLGSEIEIGKK